ncbi:hypothetical protein WICPIJ_005658 [Wickerhamomyces pijperi]|uniref:Uncharacterized protein n=1 Tax=Wickerhamomyces pijperi TaxID=599730 RepID=A0A9P8Q5V1_WICPI|nr:hypothetical protein WICPIJ_005658 [Wickerhamomyces pijperi]
MFTYWLATGVLLTSTVDTMENMAKCSSLNCGMFFRYGSSCTEPVDSMIKMDDLFKKGVKFGATLDNSWSEFAERNTMSNLILLLVLKAVLKSPNEVVATLG